MPLEIDRVPSPIGDILLVVERDAAADLLVSLDFAEYEYRMDHFNTRRYGDMRPQPATNPAGMSDRLRRYLAGDLHAFDDAAVRTSGTPFQERVWAALRTIPAGTTTTYGALAATLGNGKASRAVGLANSLNPVAICVPCHRVVGANARLTGYAGGLERKRWLLAHEAGASVRQASLDFDAQPVIASRRRGNPDR